MKWFTTSYKVARMLMIEFQVPIILTLIPSPVPTTQFPSHPPACLCAVTFQLLTYFCAFLSRVLLRFCNDSKSLVLQGELGSSLPAYLISGSYLRISTCHMVVFMYKMHWHCNLDLCKSKLLLFLPKVHNLCPKWGFHYLPCKSDSDNYFNMFSIFPK